MTNPRAIFGFESSDDDDDDDSYAWDGTLIKKGRATAASSSQGEGGDTLESGTNVVSPPLESQMSLAGNVSFGPTVMSQGSFGGFDANAAGPMLPSPLLSSSDNNDAYHRTGGIAVAGAGKSVSFGAPNAAAGATTSTARGGVVATAYAPKAQPEQRRLLSEMALRDARRQVFDDEGALPLMIRDEQTGFLVPRANVVGVKRPVHIADPFTGEREVAMQDETTLVAAQQLGVAHALQFNGGGGAWDSSPQRRSSSSMQRRAGSTGGRQPSSSLFADDSNSAGNADISTVIGNDSGFVDIRSVPKEKDVAVHYQLSMDIVEELRFQRLQRALGMEAEASDGEQDEDLGGGYGGR